MGQNYYQGNTVHLFLFSLIVFDFDSRDYNPPGKLSKNPYYYSSRTCGVSQFGLYELKSLASACIFKLHFEITFYKNIFYCIIKCLFPNITTIAPDCAVTVYPHTETPTV